MLCCRSLVRRSMVDSHIVVRHEAIQISNKVGTLWFLWEAVISRVNIVRGSGAARVTGRDNYERSNRLSTKRRARPGAFTVPL